MSTMEIDRVLSQIRSLSAQASAGAAKPAMADAAQGAGSVANSGFAQLMRQGIEQVNSAQQSASRMATAFERGTPGIELPQVMLEMQKASVSFRALTEVRNRMVSAYQEIMNMPI
ncbi:MAG: flagellar hook-basal body complex protein FliE [Steroidobacteraceae bacterium]